MQLKSADVSCEKATLRTIPLSGQAAIYSLPSPHILPACHSGAALERCGKGYQSTSGTVCVHPLNKDEPPQVRR